VNTPDADTAIAPGAPCPRVAVQDVGDPAGTQPSRLLSKEDWSTVVVT
jgi:hypothetical protein